MVTNFLSSPAKTLKAPSTIQGLLFYNCIKSDPVAQLTILSNKYQTESYNKDLTPQLPAQLHYV
jgi:hypothetical protein